MISGHQARTVTQRCTQASIKSSRHMSSHHWTLSAFSQHHGQAALLNWCLLPMLFRSDSTLLLVLTVQFVPWLCSSNTFTCVMLWAKTGWQVVCCGHSPSPHSEVTEVLYVTLDDEPIYDRLQRVFTMYPGREHSSTRGPFLLQVLRHGTVCHSRCATLHRHQHSRDI